MICARCLAYALVASTFSHFYNDSSARLNGVVSDYRGNSEGANALERNPAEWKERLPGAHTDRWEWCLEQDRETLLSFLAFCAGRSVIASTGYGLTTIPTVSTWVS